jgi:type IV pilus assembly protein PilM
VRVPLIYKDGPLFGFDIGHHSLKLVQINKHGKQAVLSGYGVVEFPADTIVEGIIIDPDVIARVVKPLMAKPNAGRITARRVAVSLPVAKSFIRTLSLPPMSSADLEQAVHLEAEQYIPVPISDLFLDYEVISHRRVDPAIAKARTAGTPAAAIAAAAAKPVTTQNTDVLMIAAPQAIINSYIQLFDRLGLEIDAVEVSLAAITRAMAAAAPSEKATLVIDFGSRSVDLTVYDQVIRFTGTIDTGGDNITEALMKNLGISMDQAHEIKVKFGIGPSGLQGKVVAAISDQLRTIAQEIKKVLKFYKGDGTSEKGLGNLIMTGGSANMPGLNEYLAAELGLGLEIAIANPWNNIKTGKVPLPAELDAPMYTTALGLALREMYRD